ncbi:MAG: hypothetical protein ACOC7L_01870 [Acidobacteriota bacterium]
MRSVRPAPGSEDSARCPSWEEQPVFRELFLAHAPPRLAAVLRHAGRLLYEDLLEAGLPASGTSSDEHWVHARVRALALDLRFIGRVLGSIAAEPLQASLDPEETSLAMKGESWGREVEELARALEAAAGPGPPPGPGSGGSGGAGPQGGWKPGTASGKEEP